MSSMLPPPAGPLAPYHIFVTAVNDSGGSPVSGAQFVLKNITKATQAPAIISNETNSNIVINVADAGAWDSGDSLELDISHGSEAATAPTTIDTTGHPMGLELGTITLQATAQEAEMILSMSQGLASSGQAVIEGAVTLSQFVGMVDGSPIESELLLSTVQSVTFTATTVIIGLITPAGRTLYVTSETSTFRIGAD